MRNYQEQKPAQHQARAKTNKIAESLATPFATEVD